MNKGVTLLIDSNALCYRAFHSKGHLTYNNSRSGVIFGFLEYILRLGTLFETQNLIFTWDSKKSFRKMRLFSGYKEKRAKKRYQASPEDQVELQEAYRQFTVLRKDILPRLGFNMVYMKTGYEGDDIIASLVNHPTHPAEKMVIVTNDHDMFQCLSDTVTIWDFGKKKMITKETFEKEKGIEPHVWPLVLAIGGCSTDNVPGVKGVGEKTAISYLNGELSSSAKASISIDKYAKDIALYEQLTKLPFAGTPIYLRKYNLLREDVFMEVFKEYNFKSFLRDPLLSKWQKFLEDDIPF